MPEQAILDLPLVEFDQFGGKPEAVLEFAGRIYALAGLPPHPDVAFHLTASLYRFRDQESLFALAALCTFLLRAQSSALAARRRVDALATATIREQQQARDDLELWQRRALKLATLALAVAGRHAAQARRNEAAAMARVRRNMEELSDAACQRELEGFVAALVAADLSDLEIDGDVPDVLASFERQRPAIMRAKAESGSPSARLGEAATSAVHDAASSLRSLGALKAELEEMRRELREAAAQLANAAKERQELEALLHESEQIATQRALALEEARGALEMSVADARERLARFERDQTQQLEQLRASLAQTTRQRDEAQAELARLRETSEQAGHELTRVLQRTAATELEREDLLTRVAAFDAEREVAARTIDALKAKLAGSKEQLARRDEALEDLNRTVEELRDELVASETRLAAAQASLLALENEADELRNASESTRRVQSAQAAAEVRLTQTQAKLADAELRISQLEAALADSKERLAQAEGRVKEQRRNVEVVSGQLAEAETLSNERAEKLVKLEAELAQARRNLGEATAKLGETSSRLASISTSGQGLEKELAAARAALQEQRQAVSRLEQTVRERDAEVARLRHIESDHATLKRQSDEQAALLRQQLERQTRELSARAGETEKETEETRQKLVAAELRLMDVQQKLVALEEDLRAAHERSSDAQGRASSEVEMLRERLTHAEAERAALTAAMDKEEGRQRQDRAALEKRVAELQAQAKEREQEAEKARAEHEKVRRKLDETDAFLIARQRELERVQTRQKYVLSEIKAIADLRARMEQSGDSAHTQAIASEVAKRLDNLFAEAGAPIHADRRTEKIVVLHLKKTDDEIKAEQGGAFVATGAEAKSQAEQEKREDTRSVEAQQPKTKRTSRKSKKDSAS